ncbi:unnamed protein product [Moneuplotes crassus]|uniref:Uncharacterized protein n=1 Tax=Euplotes crassus TaxID=5936 RepID=A0AAD1XR58_EUPCR|nr:unnamed protein product [Moneuplotes crassus]
MDFSKRSRSHNKTSMNLNIEIELLRRCKNLDKRILQSLAYYTHIKNTFNDDPLAMRLKYHSNSNQNKKLLKVTKGVISARNILFQGDWVKQRKTCLKMFKILENSHKKTLTLLPFTSNPSSARHVSYKLYEKHIFSISSSFLEGLHLKGFRIGKRQFECLIYHSRNFIWLKLASCKIDSRECIFVNKSEYKLKKLSFECCGHPTCSNWIENPQRLDDILLAISKCSLKDSLQHLNISWNSREKEKLKRGLEDLGITDLKVFGLNFLGGKRYCFNLSA